jgi:hypothetical protein
MYHNIYLGVRRGSEFSQLLYNTHMFAYDIPITMNTIHMLTIL